MSKSSKPVGTTARELRRPPETQQFTVLLPKPYARGMHFLAGSKGMTAGAMFRAWLKSEYAAVFGKEIDAK